MRSLIVAVGCLILVSCGDSKPATNAPPPVSLKSTVVDSGWKIASETHDTKEREGGGEDQETNTIKFANGVNFTTHAYRFELIDIVPINEGAAYIFFNGLFDCDACDAQTNLNIARISKNQDVPGDVDPDYFSISLAGNLLDPKNEKIINSEHQFYGKCLDGNDGQVLILKGYSVQLGKKKDYAFIVKLDGNSLKDLRLREGNKQKVDMTSVNKTIAKGLCKEIPGEVQYPEP